MQFKWYAAFHDTTHHPHIHLLVYSENTKEGFLTNEGINKIRSAFANDIFKDDLQSIYQEQTLSRDELKAVSKRSLKVLSEKFSKAILKIRSLKILSANYILSYRMLKAKSIWISSSGGQRNSQQHFSELANDDNIRQLYENGAVWRA